MRKLQALILSLSLIVATGTAVAAEPYFVLCYHDVHDDIASGPDPDRYGVSTDRLVSHFSWLRAHGYRPVGIDDILAAHEGRKPLPQRAILLTFDDGYESFYARVYPLLKLFHFPAVLALVGSWLETPPQGQVRYGDILMPRSRFLTWDQIREMQASGLVELASHTYDLHKGILGNPQGNLLPAAITREYDPKAGQYENEAAYLARVRNDLRTNSALMARALGRRPRALIWPYGRYNQPAVDLARAEGMPITFTLDDETRPSTDALATTGRYLIRANASVEQLVDDLLHPPASMPQLRVAHVDLDYVYDPDPAVQEHNLGLLLDRIKAMQLSTVFLQAFADPDGDGTASALYFPNRHLPMRADLFNRVAWQLRTRTGVRVYAWMPMLAFDLDDRRLQGRMMVRSIAPVIHGDHRRLSPFHREAQRIIGEIYQDLARHAIFDGLLFHDDAYLTDFEDASPAALETYRRAGLPASVAEIRADPRAMQRWTRLKTQRLVDLGKTLAVTVKVYQPTLKTARNLYAQVVEAPDSEAWFAQNLQDFTQAYDYTALMAMPYMEGKDRAREWLNQLLARVAETPGALPHTIFELQSRDWRNDRRVSTDELVAQIHMLLRNGAWHVAYYPEDFVGGYPTLPRFLPAISLNTYPLPP